MYIMVMSLVFFMMYCSKVMTSRTQANQNVSFENKILTLGTKRCIS